MKEISKKYSNSYGWTFLLRLFFSPITTFFTTPIQLVRTLWSSRILLYGQWNKYSHFNPYAGLNSLFYWTRASCLKRYGRNGTCPYIGLGTGSLSRFFFYTFPSLYSYCGAGAVSLLIGMFGWLLFHSFWLNHVEPVWFFTVLGLTLISTTFYSQTFILQNYNALGWMFFPIGIYGLITNNYWIAALGWLLCSFGSFTAVFIALILVACDSLFKISSYPILSIAPALLKISLHFLPIINADSPFSVLTGVAKAVGATKKNAKYKRSNKKLNFTSDQYYYLGLCLQFVFVCLYLEVTPFLFCVGIMLFLINFTFFRFSDDQSLIILQLSLAIPYLLQTTSFLLLISFWLLVSPAPLFISHPSIRRLDTLSQYAPFNIQNLLNKATEFLSTVKPEERILMSFNDPKGLHRNIYDGFRINIELISYIASQKKIHFMPDWWAVFETNYDGAPDFWGREPGKVKDKLTEWKAEYAVVYQHEEDDILDKKWRNAGFEVINKFKWSEFSDELGPNFPKPNWWLLKLRNNL